MSASLVVHETFDAGGALVRTTLAVEGEVLVLRENGVAIGQLAEEWLAPVFRRYGKPLADDVRPTKPGIALPGGGELRPLRHLATYDVIARDYLVLALPGEEPLAELATTIAAALLHLARSAPTQA